MMFHLFSPPQHSAANTLQAQVPLVAWASGHLEWVFLKQDLAAICAQMSPSARNYLKLVYRVETSWNPNGYALSPVQELGAQTFFFPYRAPDKKGDFSWSWEQCGAVSQWLSTMQSLYYSVTKRGLSQQGRAAYAGLVYTTLRCFLLHLPLLTASKADPFHVSVQRLIDARKRDKGTKRPREEEVEGGEESALDSDWTLMPPPPPRTRARFDSLTIEAEQIGA